MTSLAALDEGSPTTANRQTDDPFDRKIARLRAGGRPRVLDTFAGCGGMSLGFELAGFSIDAAVENDPLAASSHGLNFHPEAEAAALPRDITAVSAQDVVAGVGLGDEDMAFDVVIGGPPCQAYARVGRAKLREVAEHPQAFRVDPRGNLYLRWLDYVDHTKPLAVVMENVPDILNYGGHNIAAEIAEVLEEFGYEVRYSLINSAHHGVPQMRDRIFLVGLHRRLDAEPSFPAATRHHVLPPGYAGTRAVAMKHVDPDRAHFVPADTGTPDLPPAVTAAEAIGDLPVVTKHLTGGLKRGARRFDEFLPYQEDMEPSDYACRMREWPGHANDEGGIWDHALRYLPRDSDIFRAMRPGNQYPEAHAVAVRLFQDAARKQGLSEESPAWVEMRRAMVPPYPITSFPNRWWKMRRDQPVRTLMAHIGKDTYSHIHYDDAQARVMTVREAARLQSFPDGFRFAGTMNPAFRQIGNAVPPLMAAAIAGEVMAALRPA